MKIKYLDPVCCEIISGHELIKEALSYKYEFWTSGRFKKEKRIGEKSFVFGTKTKYCYTGFISRLEKYAKAKNLPFELIGKPIKINHIGEPNLPGIEFRDIQIEAINEILKHQCGLVNIATGTGKTLLVCGLLSCFDNPKMLFLARSNDLIQQSSEVFTKYGYDVCTIGDGKKEITAPIVCATAQSFKNVDLLKFSDYFNIIVVDEVQVGCKPKSEYEIILNSILSPIRVGLTATLPTEASASMFLEGMFGKVLVKADTQYGVEQGILAKPSIELLVIPENKSLKDLRLYRDIYEKGIVENVIRNKIIAKTVKKEVDEGRSCLVFCTEIDHINNLSKILNEIDVPHECVHGEISTEARTKIKNDLNNKKTMVVISSTVFTAGVDIQTLDTIINVSSGKSSEVLLQKIGRGLRVTDEKKTARIYDCLDQSPPVLASHSVKRIATYIQNGFM